MKGQTGKDEHLFRGFALRVSLVDPTAVGGRDRCECFPGIQGTRAIGSHLYAFWKTEHRSYSRALAGTDRHLGLGSVTNLASFDC